MDVSPRKNCSSCQKSRYYSILADEANDRAMKEQIALILRFVDKSNVIRQEFVSFL